MELTLQATYCAAGLPRRQPCTSWFWNGHCKKNKLIVQPIKQQIIQLTLCHVTPCRRRQWAAPESSVRWNPRRGWWSTAGSCSAICGSEQVYTIKLTTKFYKKIVYFILNEWVSQALNVGWVQICGRLVQRQNSTTGTESLGQGNSDNQRSQHL